MTDAATFAANLAKVSPAGRRLAEAFQLFARGSRQYLAVATIFGAGVALCDVVGLIVLDIRYAWLWGLLAFVTNYIPNVGFLIGLLPPTIIALLDHNVQTAIAVVVFYTVLNVVIQSVIQPRVVGNTVGLSGTLSFLPARLDLDPGWRRSAARRSCQPVREGPVHRRGPGATLVDPLVVQLGAGRSGRRWRTRQ